MLYKIFLQHAAILPCKDHKRSEFYYADFDYMMAMDFMNYRQLHTAIGFSLIPKIDAKRQERQLQTQGRYMIRHIESV